MIDWKLLTMLTIYYRCTKTTTTQKIILAEINQWRVVMLKDRESPKRDTYKNQLLANETVGDTNLLKVTFSPKHEAATRKSVQRNKANEERKKTRKRWRTSEGFNRRFACFGWVVCIACGLRLYHSGQELMNEIQPRVKT